MVGSILIILDINLHYSYLYNRTIFIIKALALFYSSFLGAGEKSCRFYLVDGLVGGGSATLCDLLDDAMTSRHNNLPSIDMDCQLQHDLD